MPCCAMAWGLKNQSLRRCKGNPSARCHPCATSTTLRWSGGDPDIPYVPLSTNRSLSATPQTNTYGLVRLFSSKDDMGGDFIAAREALRHPKSEFFRNL